MLEKAILKASSKKIIDYYETWMKNKNVIRCKFNFEQGGRHKKEREQINQWPITRSVIQ